MKLDIIFVTYNSSRWIKNNFESILNCDYDLKNVSLYYYDNNSEDDSVKILEKLKLEYSKKFNDFKIILGEKNIGFGRANNKAAKYGKSDYILFLNIDTVINKNTFIKLEKEILNSEKEIGLFELKQEKYEHPKYYDPITGETSWASGACMVIKRTIFEEIKGFDKNIFMYCEDVEISWNIRKKGYKIKYLYNVPITHYSYLIPNEFKETQYINSFISNLYLRAKYGSLKNYIKGHILCLKSIIKNYASDYITKEDYKTISKKILRQYIKMIFISFVVYIKNVFSLNKSNFRPKFVNALDYEVTKLEPFYVIDNNIKTKPLVSIIVRTCGRPNVLKETLISLRNQTYKNFEIVIIEDGKNVSEKMIKEEFGDLNIVYKSTETNVGRSKVGNIGMELAKGKYLNFLDDDDLFYPDHIEVLVTELEKNNCDILYSTAFETSISVESQNPYKYKIHDISIKHHGGFSKINLYRNNITPIQSVMFKKEVFKKCGGFDENIDALEDWDLWIRFSLKYNFFHIERTTSIYRVPYNLQITKERQDFLNSSLKYLENKHSNSKVNINPFDIFNQK